MFVGFEIYLIRLKYSDAVQRYGALILCDVRICPTLPVTPDILILVIDASLMSFQ